MSAASRTVMGLLLLAPVLAGCLDSAWKDVGDGPKIPESRWFANGAMTYLSPAALEKYEENGDALLAAAFGGGLAIPLPLAPIAAAQPVEYGGEPLALHPVTLGVELLVAPSPNTLRLDIGFHPLSVMVPLGQSGDGCDVSVWIPKLSATVELRSGRDLAGHITMLVAEVTVQRDDAEVALGPTCDAVTAMSGAILGGVRKGVGMALQEALVGADGELTSGAELLAEAMTGAGVVRRLELQALGLGPEPGSFTFELAPKTTTGAEAVTVVDAQGQLATPLSVGVDARQSASMAPMTLEKPPPEMPAPEPDLAGHHADVAIGIHIKVLGASLAALAKGGLLCLETGHGADALLLGDLRAALAAGEALPFPDDAKVFARLRPNAAPVLVPSGGPAPKLELALGSMRMELYVHWWSTDWLVREHPVEVTLHDLELVLDAAHPLGPMVRLTGGTTEAAPTGGAQTGDDTAELVRLVLDRATDGLALFPAPSIYPYPLENVVFAFEEPHLVLYGELNTTHAPRLAKLEGALQGEPAPPEMPQGTGCVQGPRGEGGALPWLGLVLLGLWAGCRGRHER